MWKELQATIQSLVRPKDVVSVQINQTMVRIIRSVITPFWIVPIAGSWDWALNNRWSKRRGSHPADHRSDGGSQPSHEPFTSFAADTKSGDESYTPSPSNRPSMRFSGLESCKNCWTCSFLMWGQTFVEGWRVSSLTSSRQDILASQQSCSGLCRGSMDLLKQSQKRKGKEEVASSS